MTLGEAKKILKQQTLPCHWGKRNKVLDRMGIFHEVNMFLTYNLDPEVRHEYEMALNVFYRKA